MKSINLVFSKKDTCVLEFYSDRNINTNKNFNSYNLFNFIKITKKEILINLISSMINIVKFLFKNITKEDIYRLYPNIDQLLKNDIDLFNSIKSGI